MSAISGRVPPAVVEFDTPTGRESKTFQDAYQARRFYASKHKQGKKPSVRGVNCSPKHAAIYCRVSTNAQATASQEPDLERWAKAQELPIVWYRDTFTGKTMDRPAWNKLEADIRSGSVSAVVVWRIDRLGRTAKGLTALFDDLRERKINLVSLRDGLDLSTPAGRLMANVLASVAQYETEVRGERVAAGQARARANGKTWGGSKPGTRRKVTLTQEKAIKQMKEQGESIINIARAVGLSRPTIYAVLSH